MDLTPSPAQEQFRDELRNWLTSNLPWDYGSAPSGRFASLDEEVTFLRGWQARLASAGYVGVSWPQAYSGRGAGPIEHFIVQEELARARAPELIGRLGVNLVGPTLLAHGTSQQRERWLPRILDASELWCQLFSEPGAGSDLASLTTRAAPVDDGWMLNGQKVWTSYGQFADWGVCLARTNPDEPRHKGISYLVVDMRSPGVDVRPLRQLTGEWEFNEVFLTDVFVPAEQLIGAEHEGWRIANSTLAHERGINPRQQVIHSQLLDDLLRLAEENDSFDDARSRQHLAQAFVEVQLFALFNLRTLSRVAKGQEPGPEASVLKLYWSEMSQRFHQTVMRILGPAAPLWQDATGNPGNGRWQRSWLYYHAASIMGGTNEIQRSIVGERVLGLPR